MLILSNQTIHVVWALNRMIVWRSNKKFPKSAYSFIGNIKTNVQSGQEVQLKMLVHMSLEKKN